MSRSCSKQIDVAEAMIYNEYAQVLEAKNPETGELYQPTDLNVINYNDVGTAMLQDALFARDAWLAQPGNEDIATRFLKASFQGWIYCRDQPGRLRPVRDRRRLDARRGPPAWMMNEINPLVWPSPNGIGMIDPAAWDQTVDIAMGGRRHQGGTARGCVSDRSRDRGPRSRSPTTPRAPTSRRAPSRSHPAGSRSRGGRRQRRRPAPR